MQRRVPQDTIFSNIIGVDMLKVVGIFVVAVSLAGCVGQGSGPNYPSPEVSGNFGILPVCVYARFRSEPLHRPCLDVDGVVRRPISSQAPRIAAPDLPKPDERPPANPAPQPPQENPPQSDLHPGLDCAYRNMVICPGYMR